MGISLTPMSCLTLQNGSRKVPLWNCRQSLEIDETVNSAHLRIDWQAVKWCHEQSYSFCQSVKWVNADRALYVRSSSGPIAIVVMTLLWFDVVGCFSATCWRWNDNIVGCYDGKSVISCQQCTFKPLSSYCTGEIGCREYRPYIEENTQRT